MSGPKRGPYGRLRGVLPALLVIPLVLGASVVVSGCSGSGSSTSHAAPSAPIAATADGTRSDEMDMPMEVTAGHDMSMTSAEMTAAWETRPSYVSQGGPEIREAYAFVLQRGSALTWMPCYCGCIGMGHGSNLDCFLLPRSKGEAIIFDEHASFCDICIGTALMTKRMLAAGSSLAQIRDAVDAEFGAGGAPGTLTDMPSI